MWRCRSAYSAAARLSACTPVTAKASEGHDGAVANARTRMCRATGRVRPEDTAVHGLSEEAVATHAPFSEEWNYFSSLRELGPLAAHYAGVENALLKSVWPYPRSSPD